MAARSLRGTAMRIAILGGRGQLGSALAKVLGEEAVVFGHEECDVTFSRMVTDTLHKAMPLDAVVNCAAYQRVDDCEDNIYDAIMVNVVGAANVASAAERLGIQVVYISTDYVFGDNGPWRTLDKPHPLNVYGFTKLCGEYLTRNTHRWLIVRTSTLFGLRGSRSKGGNFVDTMVRLGRQKRELIVVDDLVMSPTYAGDLAEAIVLLLRHRKRGVYHITNSGFCSWKQFAEEIFKQMRFDVNVKPCRSIERDRARRPKNSVLLNTRFEAEFEKLRPWQDALAEYLKLKYGAL